LMSSSTSNQHPSSTSCSSCPFPSSRVTTHFLSIFLSYSTWFASSAQIIFLFFLPIIYFFTPFSFTSRLFLSSSRHIQRNVRFSPLESRDNVLEMKWKGVCESKSRERSESGRRRQRGEVLRDGGGRTHLWRVKRAR
jgi:hypothetical protein